MLQNRLKLATSLVIVHAEGAWHLMSTVMCIAAAPVGQSLLARTQIG